MKPLSNSRSYGQYRRTPFDGSSALLPCDETQPAPGAILTQGFQGVAKFLRRLEAFIRVALDGLDEELGSLLVHVRLELPRVMAGRVQVAHDGFQRLRPLPGHFPREHLEGGNAQGEEVHAVVRDHALD